jgi:hypothetical protein
MTQQTIEQAGSSTSTDPTNILIRLGRAVLDAVLNTDLEVDVGSVLKSITVSAEGSGVFVLDVQSDADIDTVRLNEALEQIMKGYRQHDGD